MAWTFLYRSNTEGVSVVKKKSVIMLLCALLIIGSVAFGTIAYLTDRATVTNKFTIGRVSIIVDEIEVDENGKPIPNPEYDPTNPGSGDPNLRTEEENEYPLIPGRTYPKDPTLTVKAGSEESYVRMIVTITGMTELKTVFEDLKQLYPAKYPNGFVPGDFVTGRDNTQWIFHGMTESVALNAYVLEFRYALPVHPSATEDVRLPALFKTISVPGELNYSHLQKLAGLAIDVEGHAIQTNSFDTAEDAWVAFDAQTQAESSTYAQPSQPAESDPAVQP